MNCPYLYRGIVLNNRDPLDLGRCKINVPSIYGSFDIPEDVIPWSRPITQSSSNTTRVSYNIPDIDDIVWVLFEGGDKNSPVYIGGTIGTGEYHVNPREVLIYREEENYILYDRDSKTYSVKVGNNILSINESHVELSGDISIKGSVNIEGTLTLNGKML